MKKIISLLVVSAILATSSLVAFASSVVPSVGTSSSPTLVEKLDEDGNVYVGQLIDALGNVYDNVDIGEIIVTPFSEADGMDDEQQAIFEAAYEELISASSFSELTSDFADALEAFNSGKDEDDQVAEEDLYVQDFFDVHVDDDVKELMDSLGLSLVISFNVETEEDDALFVLHNQTTGDWETLYGDDAVVSTNMVTVTFTDFSPVAFVVEGEEDEDTSGDTSDDSSDSTTQTGDTSDILPIMIITGVAILAIAILVTLKIKAKKEV